MKKKKLLILAYDFPPYISVGGLRPYAWFKYLDKEKWDITVVTRFWDKDVVNAVDCVKPTSIKKVQHAIEPEGEVYRIPFTPNFRDKILLKYGFNKFVLLRRILSFFVDLLKHYFFLFDKYSEIYKVSDKLLSTEKYDVILATGEPFVLFKYGHLLSKKHKVKWVADYRDGWTTNQKKEKLSKPEFILNEVFKTLEKKYMSNVSLITTAAPSYKKALLELFPATPMEVVFNGYLEDQSVFEMIQKSNLKPDVFEISYVGTLYPHQKVELFLEGVKLLVKELGLKKGQISIKFIGMNFYDRQKERVLNYSDELKEVIHFTDKLNFYDLHCELQKASILLLLTKQHLDWLNAKIFDYILSNKRVMIAENDLGIMEEILKDVNNSSSFCNNSNEVYLELKNAYLEFQDKGYLSNTNSNLEHYTRRYQTQILADLLLAVSD